MNKDSKELLIKKLLYRSNHRGCKETDILLGKFFNANFEKFDDKMLENYQDFLEEDDVLIYDLILGKTTEIIKYQEIISKIRDFHNFLK